MQLILGVKAFFLKTACLCAETLQQVRHEAQDEVRRLYTSMAGTIQPSMVFLLAAVFYQTFFCLFDRIIVEETQMQNLKKAVNSAKGPVLLLPTHRSYMVSRRLCEK